MTRSAPARAAARPTEAPIRPVPTMASRRTPVPRNASCAAHQLGEAERQVERLARVQARVAERLVAGASSSLLEHRLGAAEALGHVLAGELEVDAAGPGALSRQAAKKPSISAMIVVEAARLVPAAVRKTFACIGSQTQTTGCSASRDGPQERRQQLLDALGAHARDQGQPAGDAVRVEPLAELERRRPGSRSGRP